jgi:hypothetical protein
MHKKNPFKYFKTSHEIIRLAVMYYVRYPLSFRQVEDILHERGIDISHETVRFTNLVQLSLRSLIDVCFCIKVTTKPSAVFTVLEIVRPHTN